MTRPICKIAIQAGYVELDFIIRVLIIERKLVLCLCAKYDPYEIQKSDIQELKSLTHNMMLKAYDAIEEMVKINSQAPSTVPLEIINNDLTKASPDVSRETKISVESQQIYDAVYSILSGPTADMVRAYDEPELTKCGCRPINCPSSKLIETEQTVIIQGALSESDDDNRSVRLIYFINGKIAHIAVRCESSEIFETVRHAYTNRIGVQLTLKVSEKLKSDKKIHQIPVKILECELLPELDLSQFLSSQEGFDI